jgi:hypothetical protein
MDRTLAERVAIVETKVSTLETMAEKVDTIYDYIVADKANRKLRNRIFASIAGILGLFISAAELLKK